MHKKSRRIPSFQVTGIYVGQGPCKWRAIN